MGVQGYQVTANRSSTGFLHTPIPQGHPSMHHPPLPIQGVRGHNMNFPSPLVTSRRFSTNSTSINSFQAVGEAGPRYMGPVPPTGFRLYRPHRRDVAPEMNARHRAVPHLRVLPEDVKLFLSCLLISTVILANTASFFYLFFNLCYLMLIVCIQGVAMLEVPGYHEVADSPDQHRDMRLDIDHMSYEVT